jgi:hypothetical protein
VTPEELVSAYDETLSRLAGLSPEPGPAHRLIDPLLRLFGRDSRTYAVRERAALLDRAARDAVAGGNAERRRALDAALARRRP